MIVGVDWSQQLFRLGRRSVDMAMEASVVGSFTKIGYNVRSRMYDWDALPDMTGRTVVITGATSGLGRAAADELGAFGAELILVGRDKRRTQTAARSIAKKHGGSVQVVIADLGELDSVREASVELAQLSRIDALIHNAGALTNTYEVTSDGFERTFATHVLGPFAMTRELLPIIQRTGDGRVITMTSGGMYAERLDVKNVMMGRDDYDGLRAYARAKRAQVALNEEWALREPSAAVFHAVHPGWADTPGVQESLPRFNRVMGPLLRDSYQGADTMVWLAAAEEPLRSSGVLWLDRHPRHKNKVPWTITGPEQSAELWDFVEHLTSPTQP
ncbi:MAG: SDR family NAD(P)-dependent oxidoreductase [Candidatus Nanopelagicales bacterium]